MEIKLNCIIENIISKERFRVLAIFLKEDIVILISFKRRDSLPFEERYSYISSSIETGDYVEVEDKDSEILPGKLTEKQEKILNENWSLIENFVNNEPLCYDRKIRSTFIGVTAEKTGRTRKDIQRLLYRYWIGGMMKNALIPKYKDRGGKGKGKTIGDKPLGRPVKNRNANSRLIIGEKELGQIKRIVDAYYNKSKKFNFSFSYDELISTFYTDKETKKQYAAYPTYEQFKYHAAKFIDIERRAGNKKFNKDMRGIVGNSMSEAIGPGEKYQIDATVGDIYLVSRFDINQVIGRPVIYFVTDVFSRMITGFYVGLEGPSWIGAMMAILYTIMNKAEIFKIFNLKVCPDLWPCMGLPKKLLVDNGELIGKNSNNIIEGLGIRVQNTSAWRPDMKGIVEQSFNLLNTTTKMILPGAIQPDYKERGATDYRHEALLNIRRFTQIIILYIIKYNQRMLTQHPQRTEDILRDKVPAIPLKLWNWGISNQSGRLRQMEEEKIKVALMPHTEASVTPRGILFQKMYFTCSTAIKEKWFSKARINGTWKCRIAYDPRNTDYIYILYNDGNFELCSRTKGSRDVYPGWDYEEVIFSQAYENAGKAIYSTKMLDNEISFQDDVEAIIAQALEEKKMVNYESIKNKNDITNIKENRRNERESIRKEEVFTPTEEQGSVEVARKVAKSNDSDDNGYAELASKFQKEEATDNE